MTMQNREPYFSIIIPAFNSSLTIASTLESIYQQTDSDYEVIIIDDMSSDFEVLKTKVQHFIDKGMVVNLFPSLVKLNGSGARNKGVSLSRGKYIALMDSDDEWCANKLSVVKRNIENNIHGDFIYYSRVKIVSEDRPNFQKIMPLREFKPETESMASYLFGCVGFIQTSSIVLKRALYEKISFDPKFIRHQDYDFCIRADSFNVKFFFLDEVLSIYKMAKKSNISKGETIKYSLGWLSKMSHYLTKNDIRCFKAFKLSKKYSTTKGFILFIYNFILCDYNVKKGFLYSLFIKIKNLL